MRQVKATILGGLMITTALTVLSPALAQDADLSYEVDDQIIVRGVNIPDEKRATSEISNLLTPEKLERTGDSDIAQALRRVTGLSLSQGKFIVVRGLNERYSNLTLNGSPLPSPEPLRRVAPLDLFPTSVVGSALVQKTFSPQYSGEFGGGLIELRSKALPDEGFFEVGLNVGLDTETTARNGLTYDGGNWDWAGFDDGARDLPDVLANTIAQNPGVAIRAESGIDETTLRSIGASLVNSELRVVQEGSTPVNHGFSLAGGDRYDLDNGMSIGFVVNAGYGRDFQTKQGQQGDAAIGPNGEALVRNEAYDFQSTTETITSNALISAGVEFNDDHSFNILAMALRKTTKEARERLGTEELSLGGFDEILISNLEFFENQVWTLQGNSEHFFPSLNDLSINLRVAYSEAFRDAPYETSFTYVREDEATPFRSAIGLGSGASASGFDTRFSRVDDKSFSFGGDANMPLTIGSVDVDLKAGGAYSDTERDYVLRQFGFRNDTGIPDGDQFWQQRIDFLLADRNIGEQGGFEFIQVPDLLQPGAYRGEMEIIAGYGGAEFQLGPYVRAAAGVRFETSEQIVDNFAIAGFSPVANNGPETTIDEDYFLPAFTITWNPLDNIQVRGAFSQTITRPQFQELGAAIFTDTDRDIQVFGNPFLVNTEAMNVDARIEYYFGREQFITIGGFYKDLENPIEESLLQTGDDILTTYINAPSAELYGAEIEYEQRFVMGDIFKEGWLGGFSETKDLIISANYTFSQSSVGVDGQVTTPIFAGANVSPVSGDAANFFVDGRSLQGQSDHIVNFQIGYEDYELDSRLTLLFNWNSERIRQVGLIQGANVPNVVERLPMTVDFAYGRRINLGGEDFDMQAKIGNILNDNYEATADGAIDTSIPIDVYDLGTTVSLSLKKEF
ncbi:MAG: TonB-dependent receptor [Pseudomonadota bacterium]